MRTKLGRFVLTGVIGLAALGLARGAQADDRYHGHGGGYGGGHGPAQGHGGHNGYYGHSGHGYYSRGHGGYGYYGYRPYAYSRPYYYAPYGYGYGYGYGNGYGYAYAPPVYVPYRPYCGPRVGVGLSLGFGF